MNLIDFNEWQAEHKLLHYEFAAFCDKQAEADNAYHKRQLEAWFQTVKHVSLKAAKEVSEMMARGETDEPKGPGDHAKIVAREARKLDIIKAREARPRMINGEYAARCRTCRDDGLVCIVDYRTIRTFLDSGRLNLGPGNTVACTCTAGDARSQRGLQRYDPTNMPRWPDLLLDWSTGDWDHAPAKDIAVAAYAARDAFLRGWLAERGHHAPPAPEEPKFIDAGEQAIIEAHRLAYEVPAESADALPF